MKRPNVLLITTDQQRFDTISALGNPLIYTPHLNWLCDEGVAFTRCYADCPVCMPSRATIMTGLSGYTLGLTSNRSDLAPLAEHLTLPGMLTAAGYQTHAQGKMHFQPFRAHYGFEEMELPADYFREKSRYGRAASKVTGVGENEIEPVISGVREEDSLTWWTVERSIDFLETRDETRPFFLWTSFTKPHPPFECLPGYWMLYQNLVFPEPVRGDWDAPPGMMAPSWKLNNAWRMTTKQLEESRRAYYGCITQIDYNLGRLFARMREMKLLENTWILFTSDHGDMMGDHGMGAKSTFLEGSAHVPFLVRPPAASKERTEFSGKRCGELVTLADVMPTILAACDVECPDTDGMDLISVYREKKARDFFGVCATNSVVYSGRYKYMFTNAGGEELLFDMEADPQETKDLSRKAEYREEKERLKSMLQEYLKEHQPDFLNRDGRLVSVSAPPENTIRWPGFHSERFPSDTIH